MQKYKELRADDAQGGIGRHSYRITVRQLESMIRLSEAIAKANCVDDVSEDFVREAASLLRSSIISVEKEDVEVDEEEDAEERNGNMNGQADADGDGDSPMAEGNENEEEAPAAPALPRQRTKITYDKYMAMLNLLVRHINSAETESGEGVEHEELVLWYLEQKEDEISTEIELEEERELVRKVLKRMVKVRRIPLLYHFLVQNNLTDSFCRIIS